MIGKLASEAKQAVQQLVQSKQIKHAMKGIGRDVVSTALSNASSLGNRLLSSAPAAQKQSGKKRSYNDAFAENKEAGEDASPQPKRIAATSASRIGYRGKAIQRGGTKQKCARFLF